VLLLVIAGARVVPSLPALWLLAPYMLCRLAGKVAGAWLATPLLGEPAAEPPAGDAAEAAPALAPSDLAAFLMPPGVLALAFALHFQQILPADDGTVLLSTVAAGTAAFELFAIAVLPRWRGSA
jgi:hypothetical protein